MEQLIAVVRAVSDFIVWVLVQPGVAMLVGGWAGGYAHGTSKNKSALVEIFRGVIVGLAWWALISFFQYMITAGGAV